MASRSAEFNDKTRSSARPGILRLNIDLTTSTENGYPCYDVALLEEQARNAAIASRDGALSEDEEEKKLAAIPKRRKEKYGRSYGRHTQDTCDLGKGYDTDDSFIDNAEAYDELVPSSVSTEHGGFYVNWGKLKFRNIEAEEGPTDAESQVNERGRQDDAQPVSNTCKAAAKPKKCLSKPKPPTQRKALTPSSLKNREKNIEAVVDAVVRGHVSRSGTPTRQPKGTENAVSAAITQEIREETEGTKGANENAIPSGSNLSSASSSQQSNAECAAGPSSADPMTGQPPGPGYARTQRSYAIPEALLAMCDDLAKMVGSAHSCLSRWSPDALDQLMNIQKACQENGLNRLQRGAVFRHVRNQTGVPQVELCAFVNHR